MIQHMNMREALAALEGQMKTDPRAALCGWIAIAQAAPDYPPARFRAIEALLTLGEVRAAAELLGALALGYARRGEPIPAIHACKLLEGMGQDSDRAASEIGMIYAGLQGSELVPTPSPVEAPEIEPPPPVAQAGAIAAATALGRMSETQPERFPALPLLSRLTPEDFIIVLRAMKLHRVAHGARIISQGAEGASCFLITEGELLVTRQSGGEEKVLTRLYPGTIFGEMALVSRRPRNASITSVGGATVLELTRATLLAHSQAMRDALYVFTRRRLLENITLTSPLLQPLGRDARKKVVGLFGSFPISAGEPIVREGEPGQGLYVILRGAVRVSAHREDRDVELATLGEGDLFGEISLLRDTPTTASVTGLEDGEVLFLDKSDFLGVTAAYPEVTRALAALTEERLRTQELMLDHVAVEDALSLI